ncbi:MAG: PEP-CTERM sorting domain-containing protein [Coleofasciculus sp. G3-WIS-01]|uniref:PEP-CTERM sorting domain-containing protein n=1 Tax=Coleofasciculus sp. G3-WIS-01 TaxID=3069528 RepID=UPI0032F637A3
MLNIPQRIAAITASAILGVLALESKPVKAAEFYDHAEFGFTFEQFGGGNLSFNVADDNLNQIQTLFAGDGVKQVSLEELKSVASDVKFDFDYQGYAYSGFPSSFLPPFAPPDPPPSLHIGGSGSWTEAKLISDPIFTFNSNELVGLELKLSTNTNSTNYSSYPGIMRLAFRETYVESNNLFINGEQFNQHIDVYYRYCTDTMIGTYCNPTVLTHSYDYTGEIDFTTDDPLELTSKSVPEPSTLTSLCLLGLGLILKRNVNSSEEKP